MTTATPDADRTLVHPDRVRRRARAPGAALALLLALAAPAAAQTRIDLDPSTTYQTITGWEVLMDWRDAWNWPNASATMNEVIDRSVNEVGINRFRLEVASGLEHSTDNYADWKAGRIDDSQWKCVRYATVNDNGSPDTLDPSGFQWTWLDDKMVNIVLPLKQAVEANGEQLYINLNYVAFTHQTCSGGQYHHTDPDEYAEFILAVFLHLRDTYGIVPDAVEALLEPDRVGPFSGNLLGRAIVAAAAKLQANGFSPRFIGPSAANMGGSIEYFGAMIQVPGVQPLLKELSYHRYSGVTNSREQQIVSLAAQHGLETAMLEWWEGGNTYHQLHEDLEKMGNSAYQRGGLGIEERFNQGTELFVVSSSGAISMNTQTRLVAQYFRWVRAGAVRIGASSSGGGFAPLAFVNPDGSTTVVLKAGSSGTVEIQDLPAGRYQSSYSTPGQFDVRGPEVDVPAGGVMTASIPRSGVLTVFRTDGSGSPPPPPDPPEPTAPRPPILLGD